MNMEIPDIRAELADEFETARKSTGPRTADGKQRSAQNARKHGFYGKNFYWEASITLGEDPREHRRRLRGLIAARRPADALEMALVEDIALLYTKKAHLENAEVAVQALNLRQYDLERKKLCVQVLRGDNNTSEYLAYRNGLRNHLESPGQFEEVINRLWQVVTRAETDDFSRGMKEDLLVVYGNDPTLRGGNLDTHYQLLKDMKRDHPKYEALKQELVQSAMHEIADLANEYQLFLDEHVQTTRVARVAAMVPTDSQWTAIVRQQNALDRLLERKIRLLMDVQQHRILYAAPAPAVDPSRTPPGGAPAPRDPAPGCDTAPGCDPAPCRDTALSPGERVARDGAFTSRSGTGEGLLHCGTDPSQNTENSGNELDDLLQSQGLAQNDPSKRTASSAPNEPVVDTAPPRDAALSRGEKVARDGAFSSRSGTGEGLLHCGTDPSQNTENSRNELHDLLQSKALTRNDPSKRTVSSASNEPVGTHACASGNRGGSRRARSGSADRRVCGPRFFVEGGRGHRITPGMKETRTAKPAARAANRPRRGQP